MTWCANILDVDGDEAECARFSGAVTGVDDMGAPSVLSFGALVPQPEHLTNSTLIVTWRRGRWGTKSEATDATCAASPDGGLRYRFATRNSGPVPWLRTATETYPTLRFRYSWFEEAQGLAGWAEARAGEVIHHVSVAAGDRDLAQWRREVREALREVGSEELVSAGGDA